MSFKKNKEEIVSNNHVFEVSKMISLLDSDQERLRHTYILHIYTS